MKCNRCNLAIDPAKDAHVVMPNPEQCGFKSRRPAAFAHASCFERDVRVTYRREMEADAERQKEIEEVMAALSPCLPDSDQAGACLALDDLACPVHGALRRSE